MSDAGAPLVRRTAVADWQALRAVRLRALDQDPDAFGSTHALALALPDEEYRRRAAAEATHLAFSDGEPVGIVVLVPAGDGDPAHGELASMWVEPGHRGTGLAQRLVEAACAKARIDGVREVALWVTVGNAPAQGLYERCGLTLTSRRRPVHPEQPERLEEQMRRVLIPPPGEGHHVLTRPDGVTGGEMLAELGALLIEGGHEPAYVDGAFVLRRYDGEPHDPPLLLHVSAEQAADLVDERYDARDLWPDSTPERGALNLFLVHVDETVATRHDENRRHLVLGPRGLVCVTDPAVPDEPRALPPRFDVPEGAVLAWTTGEPGADVFPPPPADGGPRDGAGTGVQMGALRALLGAEVAYAGGHLPDETLTFVQDQASAVIGLPTLSSFGDEICRLAPPDGDVDVVLADPALCQALLRALLADG